MDYIQVSAKTVEDAVLEAAMKLATTRDHLEYEVIEKGSNGFFGLGAKPVIIKARALSDEEIEKSEKELRNAKNGEVIDKMAAGMGNAILIPRTWLGDAHAEKFVPYVLAYKQKR